MPIDVVFVVASRSLLLDIAGPPVFDGCRASSAGATAGIDLALQLIALAERRLGI